MQVRNKAQSGRGSYKVMTYVNKMDFLASIVTLELRTPSKTSKEVTKEGKGVNRYCGHYNKIYYLGNARG